MTDQDSSDQEPTELTEVLDRIVNGTDGETVSVEEVLAVFNNRAYGPLLMVPALLAVSPLGMIPGMSVVMGGVIFLVAAQMIFFSSRPWLPQRLLTFSFSRDRLRRSVDKVKPWARRIQRPLSHRLAFIVKPPLSYLLALTCVALAAMMYPLALLPFAVAVPGTAVLFFGIGLTVRDGLLVLLGYAATGGAVWLVVWAV